MFRQRLEVAEPTTWRANGRRNTRREEAAAKEVAARAAREAAARETAAREAAAERSRGERSCRERSRGERSPPQRSRRERSRRKRSHSARGHGSRRRETAAERNRGERSRGEGKLPRRKPQPEKPPRTRCAASAHKVVEGAHTRSGRAPKTKSRGPPFRDTLPLHRRRSRPCTADEICPSDRPCCRPDGGRRRGGWIRVDHESALRKRPVPAAIDNASPHQNRPNLANRWLVRRPLARCRACGGARITVRRPPGELTAPAGPKAARPDPRLASAKAAFDQHVMRRRLVSIRRFLRPRRPIRKQPPTYAGAQRRTRQSEAVKDLLDKGDVFRRERSYVNAIQSFQAALTEDPDSRAAGEKLAEARAASGERTRPPTTSSVRRRRLHRHPGVGCAQEVVGQANALLETTSSTMRSRRSTRFSKYPGDAKRPLERAERSPARTTS
jgi:hypothetical protein